MLNNKEYNFELEVTENLELMSKWEKINNDSNSNNSNNNSEPSKQENIKVETQTLSSGTGSGIIVLYVGFTIQLEGHYAKPNAMDTITGWNYMKR